MTMTTSLTIEMMMTIKMMSMMSKVTGGQGENDEVLGSAEFFDLSTQQWTMVIIPWIMGFLLVHAPGS